MNQLKCEMCGSTDVIKQDGMFVCQVCGTRYSVEDAKKMMIEGTVDVQGTVKVDNSSFVEKYLFNARRALDKEDWEEVEKYYNLVEQNDPQNIEAIFFSSYGKAMISLCEEGQFKLREQKFNVFKKSISVIDDYYNPAKCEELKPIIQKMSEYLIKMTQSSFMINWISKELGVTDETKVRLLFCDVEMQFIESLENIISKDEQKYIYIILLNHYSRCIQNKKIAADISAKYQQKMKEVNARLVQIDPSFHAVEVPQAKSGGCYVATCVYGSYDCPEVWTLRRYRDSKLGSSRGGRAFIRLYYAISPTLVKWFGNTKWFKKMWRGVLDKKVKKLQAQGYESTPYNDIDWRKK